jgi:hypothetical protein
MNVRPKQKTKLGCGNKQREKRKKKKTWMLCLFQGIFGSE